jgi:hypothetical protein
MVNEMKNWKGHGKQSGVIQGTIVAFTWRDQGKP